MDKTITCWSPGLGAMQGIYRIKEILALAQHFLGLANERFGKTVKGFSSEVLNLFEMFSWPGNVGQLQKEIERLVVLNEDAKLIQST